MVGPPEKRHITMVFVQKTKTSSFNLVLRKTMVGPPEKRHITMVFEEKRYAEQPFSVHPPKKLRPFQLKTEGGDAIGLSGMVNMMMVYT